MSLVSESIGQRCHITGRYLSRRTQEDPGEIARCIVNLVSQQGAGPVCVTPADLIRPVTRRLAELDPSGAWARWWSELSGQPLSLVTEKPAPANAPGFRTRIGRPDLDRMLGINIGGCFLRVVWLANGQVEHVEQIRLGVGAASLLAGARVNDIIRHLPTRRRFGPPRCVGIAWSAPRGPNGLRRLSVPMRSLGEIARAVEDGSMDSILSRYYRCPVFSWNDGEAAAAAEALERNSSVPLIALKLGTSLASGIHTSTGVSSLPFQLSKTLPKSPSLTTFRHPVIGLRSTLRDVAGAEAMSRVYRVLAADDTLDYDELCRAVESGRSMATDVVRTAGSAIAQVVDDVIGSWGPVDLVITGKNVESAAVHEIIADSIGQQSRLNRTGGRLLRSGWDVDLSTAVGACVLSADVLARC